MTFNQYKGLVQKQMKRMTDSSNKLYVTDVDKDVIWETFLESFPTGSNQTFRERREYDCNHCRHFIQRFGSVVAIIRGKVVSIWDIPDVQEPFVPVTEALSKYVKSRSIVDVFVHDTHKLGVNTSKETQEKEGEHTYIHTWHHLYVEVPKKIFEFKTQYGNRHSPEAIQSELRSGQSTFKRALQEITVEACETVLDLIAQNSLYRGEEHKAMVDNFLAKKNQMTVHNTDIDMFAWMYCDNGIARIRNTVIGTLLIDISEGKTLDAAVGSYEAKVAPSNYKRPKALFTSKMVEAAEAKLEELGLTSSLERRHATLDDMSAGDMLHINRDALTVQNKSIFQKMKEEAPARSTAAKALSNVEEITIDKFISDVLPTTTSMEILFENQLEGNLVNLIAPSNATAPSLFPWDNGFSWSYNNNVADSIRKQVEKAGGRTEGELRASLSWFNYDDLDLHVIEPDGRRIYYQSKKSRTSDGELDVDMNAGGGHTRKAVENIIFPTRSKMLEGKYQVIVHQYQEREDLDVGFNAEIECRGQILSFSYKKAVRQGEQILVAEILYSRKEGMHLVRGLQGATENTAKTWNLKQEVFHPVLTLMMSPNHWGENRSGNRHYFFMIDDCSNPEAPRGFFNEFLKEELLEQKRVFEALGSRLEVPESDKQLAGLGFSSTVNNTAIVSVKGSFTRKLKLIF